MEIRPAQSSVETGQAQSGVETGQARSSVETGHAKSSGVEIRPAHSGDVEAMHEMIVELAEYEREPDAVIASAEDLRAALFAEQPHLFADVATIDGNVIGMTIWFYNYSTWLGRHGIYLEDLYVRPSARGKGVGEQLLKSLAQRCMSENLGRLDWWVLRWNNQPDSSAGRLYSRIGAKALDEWVPMRLTGDELKKSARD